MDGRVKTNPDLCKCPSKKDGCQCNKAFLQGTKGDIRAKEMTTAGEPPNLAAPGRYQGCEGMTKLKGLTLLTIEFLSPDGMPRGTHDHAHCG